MAEKSKILIIGATGYIGKFLVEASVKAGHPTFILVRESATLNPEKSKVIDSFQSLGVTILHGDVYDHVGLVSAIKKVEVVISTIGSTLEQLGDQVKIIAAIKEAGNVKRFIPSEFGADVDRHHAVEPAATQFEVKAKIRRAIEDEGIPHTYVVTNCFFGVFLSNLVQTDSLTAPREKVTIPGDGNAKAVFVKEEDIAAYTIKAADDPRALNKILYMKPPANTLSFNEMVSLWESKIGKTLEKTFIHEEQYLKNIQEAPETLKFIMAVIHCIFIKGDATNIEIEASFGVEASELYPELNYTTVDEYLSLLA